MGFYAYVIVKKKPYMNCKWCDLSLFIIIIIKYKKGLVSYMSRYEKLLEVRKLHKYYSKDVVSTKALNGISFDVLKGEYLGIMGASGSGKSTLTHATHNNKYEEIQVLHDDAFIINTETGASIAMEPTYFDKTADYPTGCPDNKYLLTAQNCSATRDSEGKVVLVTEDIRNGNGRAIKSKLWSPNRVDKINDPVNAIFWIMKDPTIPPIVKIKGASLASVMGATLATKRSSAERLAPGVDPNRLVVEPYANPFRTYPLVNDYKKFRKLVKERNVDCYIINTGDFMGKDIKPATTISAIEQVVEGTGEFKQWGPFTDIEVLEMEGYVSDFNDMNYVETLKARMTDRLNFVFEKDVEDGGYNALPTQAKEALAKVIGEAHNLEVENSNN